MKKKQIGTAMVEFALVLPLLLILTFITTEFSRALYQYNTLTKSVRDAARYLSIQNPTILTTDPSKITVAKNLVVYGNPKPAGTDSPLAFGLASGQVKDPVWRLSGASPVINTVTVTVAGCANSAPPCYKFVPLMAGVFGVTFGNINYADISATMRAPL
jgi:Flp pilus assembly protein TadG